MKSQTITFIFAFMLCISFASALWERTVEVTDLKEDAIAKGLVISDSAMKYPAVEVVGFWDGVLWIEDKKADLILTQHNESCGQDCMSEFQISTASDSPLVDDIKFYRLDEGQREERNIRNYQFQYYGDVQDYTTECSQAKLTEEELLNETKPYETCIQVESGSHKDWINYNIGEVLPAGTYDVKLLGQKAPYMSIDWVMKTSGKTISEWATWGNISTGSQAEVRLNSPANNSIQYVREVTTNASANVTNGAYLTNATLYDNSTGSWGARNTSLLIGWVNTSVVVSDWNVGDVIRFTYNSTFSGNNVPINYKLKKWNQYDGAVGRVKKNGIQIGTDFFPTGYADYESAPTIYTNLNVGDIITWRTDDDVDTAVNITNVSVGIYPPITSTTITNTNTYTSSPILWNYQFCDTDGACGFATSNRTFSIDSVAPTITLNDPTPLINYGAVNGTLQLNFTVTDSNLANVWYNYNGTNITIAGAVSGVANLSNITLSTKKNVTIYANDTAGNLNTTTFGWDYYVWNTGQSYNTQVLEGSTELFSANLTLTPTYRLSYANLIYNGTSYTGTSLETSTNNYYISRNLLIPEVSSSVNKTFYWTLGFENGQIINTTELTQETLVLLIDNCSTYTQQIFNLTMKDEATQTVLVGATANTSIKLSMSISSLDGSTQVLNFSKFYDKVNPARVCVSQAYVTSQMSMDAVIEYSSVASFTEFYNIQNYILNSTTQSQNITLYNLKTAEGQEFKVTYKGLDFVPVADVIIQIQRKYIDEGVFKTIEIPMSGTNGYTIAHLVPNDVVYNLIFIKDGAILDTFLDVIATCQNPTFTDCEINLNALVTGVDLFGLVEETDFFSSLSYTPSTRTISSTYGIVSGVSGTTNLQVYLMDNLGTTVVCNDSLVAAGGTLSCVVPEAFGNGTIHAQLSLNGEVRREGFISMNQKPKELFNGILMFMSIIMLLFLLGIGVQENPMIMGVFLVFGLMVLIGLNLVYSTSWIGAGATVLWFIIAVVMILIKGGNKR